MKIATINVYDTAEECFEKEILPNFTDAGITPMEETKEALIDAMVMWLGVKDCYGINPTIDRAAVFFDTLDNLGADLAIDAVKPFYR
ncbi:hypothetical protein [Corynebacterium pyruviciproducens]|uniref:hypothetical protein n=1 Tax=Corynebacterium pyruviciproducens TaxID=598660 RepID=UPI002549ED53|nr:hypothetical protein [Corynebacterium pyruviciproducens]MDK7213387.1 hypothetical protein [Corynebacterium pyruviciproducens]